jgi:hypothetical protein
MDFRDIPNSDGVASRSASVRTVTFSQVVFIEEFAI